MLHHEESPEKSQYNRTTPPFLDKGLPFCFERKGGVELCIYAGELVRIRNYNCNTFSFLYITLRVHKSYWALKCVIKFRHVGQGYASMLEGKWERSKVLLVVFLCLGCLRWMNFCFDNILKLNNFYVCFLKLTL